MLSGNANKIMATSKMGRTRAIDPLQRRPRCKTIANVTTNISILAITAQCKYAGNKLGLSKTPIMKYAVHRPIQVKYTVATVGNIPTLRIPSAIANVSACGKEKYASTTCANTMLPATKKSNVLNILCKDMDFSHSYK